MLAKISILRPSSRSALAVTLVLTGAAFASGCSRTDDGSVLMYRPSMQLGFGQLGERLSFRSRARAREQAQLTAFPAPPPAVAEPAIVEAPAAEPAIVAETPVAQPVAERRRPRRAANRAAPVNPRNFRAPRVTVKAPFRASTTEKPLTCTDMAAAAAQKPGGRVQVNCQ